MKGRGAKVKACLYTNGTILTMESTLAAEAVLTVDGADTQSRDAGRGAAGRARGNQRGGSGHHVLLPAFIDPHSHITAYAHTLSLVQLEGAAGFDELLERIGRSGRKNGWGRGTGSADSATTTPR